MAWYIPQELRNNNPLNEAEVRKRFLEKGYEIINYTYKNNETRMNCYDKNGYKVKVSLSSLGKNVKQYERFGLGNNSDNFLYNANIYQQKYNIPSKVLDFRKSKIQHHIDVLCLCECGEQFWCDFALWKNLNKTLCNNCSKRKSTLEARTQNYLDELGINYIAEYIFNDCRDKKPLPFDFYLTDYNICIEIDGEGHYSSRFHISHTNSKEKREELFNKTLLHDEIKTQYCKNKNIKLLRLKYDLYRNNKKPINKFKEKIDEIITLNQI